MTYRSALVLVLLYAIHGHRFRFTLILGYDIISVCML